MLHVNRVNKPNSMMDKIGQCLGVQSYIPQEQQQISTKHTNYELLMGHLDIRTYEKKKLDRKNEEK